MLQGERPEDLYHTRDTLRGTKVLKVVESSYPSPDGDDCHKDIKIYEAAQEMCRIKRRMLRIVMKKILEAVEEQFDMSAYAHRRFALLAYDAKMISNCLHKSAHVSKFRFKIGYELNEP